MPRYLIFPIIAVIAALVFIWASGGFDQIAAWAAAEQRDFQNRIARTLRALRGGDAGAMSLLLFLCFAYGFFHAVGPGHGKILIGGYGVGRRVSAIRLTSISLISSLGQSATAIALVYGGVWLFTLTRERMIGISEDIMAPASYAAIVAIGGWLVWRGVRRGMASHPHHDHDHNHDHGHGHDHGAACNHKHGPDLEELEAAGSFRENLAIVAGIAARPCTGALFVLLITWQMGIAVAGIAGAIAMGLGTATVTITIGLAAVGLRGGVFGALAGSNFAVRFVPIVEVVAGLMIVVLAGGLLLTALA